ncbi:MAG: leucyl aminopeptidase [Candidatus Omnitrophica bacterium]|nr:leucyl aminopeptidase [Candidatus Omnitrophota bacterium]
MIKFSSKMMFDKGSALVLLTSEQAKAGKFVCSSKDVALRVNDVLKSECFEGGKGEVLPLIIGKCCVVLLGLGKEKELNMTVLRGLVRRALMAPYFKKAADIEIQAHQDSLEVIRALIEAKVIGTYSWKKYISRKKDDKTIENKTLHIVTAGSQECPETVLVAECVNLARDLVNENADVVTAEYLEKTVLGLVKGRIDVETEILGRKKLEEKKFGLLLAVNKGSSQAPRVVIVRYNGGKKGESYTAIVGKGLTFDSGGLNLKPSGSIETMRSDMSGAAAVIGALKATLQLKLKKNIIFAFGATENAIDANAYKPGDVFVGYSGKSVEIGNTDAEGRLVLADVIAYVIDKYKPARLVDLATLTGACVVALGHDYAGLMSNNDVWADAVTASAAATDDRTWRLPLYPELKDMIKSKIADVKNISNQRGSAGTLTAAAFLQQFVGETPWAHLDIAGTAFVDGDSRMYYGHGATGFGVRLLVDMIKKS